MSEQDKPKKTLSLKKTTTADVDPAAPPKLRSGARAKVALNRLRQQAADTPAQEEPTRPTSRSAASKRPAGRSNSGPQGDRGRSDRPRRPATAGEQRDRSERPNRRPTEGASFSRNDRNKERPQRRSAAYDAPARTRNDDERPTRRPHPRDDAPRSGGSFRRKPESGFSTTQQFPVFAPCPQGMEEVLEAELQALGYENAKMGKGGCHFTTDWQGVLKANLYSRIATRILIQLAKAPVHNEDDIYALAHATPWEQWFGPDDTLRVDTSAIRSPMQSLQFCNLRTKDAICDRLREREGARPSIDTVRPDAKVHLFLDATSATLYLDTSGESLFKRGWRHNKGEAPLRENLAAGLLALSDWDPSAPLMDPFCGSGTILIEAAWIALGAPPGIWRPFHFERLRIHDDRMWRDLKEDARSRIAPKLEAPLVGYDLDPAVIDAAKRNLERAHLTPDTVRFEVGNALEALPIAEEGWLISNPPYGERLEGNQEAFWRDWSAWLKQHYAGWNINVITSDLTLPNQMRLKPKRRIPLYNGSLECRLFSFEMVAAGYR